jgi:hypothetical protein
MFTRPSLIKTQIKKNKQGKRSLMKTLGIFELHNLVDKTYNEFCNGKNIEKIFQEHAVSKKHKNDYITLILDKFLRQDSIVVDTTNQQQIKMLSKFAMLTLENKDIDLGFVYCIKNKDKIKIGRTTNLLKRFNNYKSHIGEFPEIVRVLFIANHTDFEKSLIKKLSNFGYTSEWFDYTHHDLIISYFS